MKNIKSVDCTRSLWLVLIAILGRSRFCRYKIAFIYKVATVKYCLAQDRIWEIPDAHLGKLVVDLTKTAVHQHE